MYFDFTTLMSPKMLLNEMELLRILHSLYDPMGVLIPFTITGKLALQMCSRQGLTWKAKLPDDIKEAWDPWMAQKQELNGYSFIRTIIPGEQPNKTNKQIHVFADASKDAYAAVAYMRCESNGKVTVRFIQAKSRVRPVKAAHTIPRMELSNRARSTTGEKDLQNLQDRNTQSIHLDRQQSLPQLVTYQS
jgi:hypothetical protein